MIALLQRVSRASVRVEGEVVGAIAEGLAVLTGVQKGDGEAEADRLLERLLAFRVFPDGQGRMNLSVRDAGGALLLVPQFTLPADTTRGTRPSFSRAAPPEIGRRLFERFVRSARAAHPRVETGVFGERMQLTLVNEGPVTFWLEVTPAC